MSASRAPASSKRDLLRGTAAAVALAIRAAPGVATVQIIATLAIGFIPVATAWATKLILDRVAVHAPREELFGLIGIVVGIGALHLVLAHLTRYLTSELGRAVALDAQDRLYTAVNRQTGLSRLEDPRYQDHLRLAQQAGRAGPGEVLDGIIGMAQGLVTLAGFLTAVAVIYPPMAVLLLVAAIPGMVPELALSRRRAQMIWGIGPAERRELFYGNLLTSLTAAKEIRLFALGDLFRTRMLTEIRTAHREHRRMDKREAYTHIALALLSALLSGVGLTWAVLMAAAGRLSVGDVAVFVAGVGGTQAAIGSVISRFAGTHHALLLFGHYRHVIALEPDLATDRDHARRSSTMPPARTSARAGIEFRDVWFRYGDGLPWTLRGLDLTLPAGQSLGLVGPNGAGKSTIVKLLCRFYDPTRGRILWDGIDIIEWPVADLRLRIGAVFQDYMSYDLSAAENIGIGDTCALNNRTKIELAATEAGVHDVLTALPLGYETMLSRTFFLEVGGSGRDEDEPDTGVLLSGGQWQRVALARAFLRTGRDLLILDEPSSGLDPQAEHEIHARLHAFRRGTTSLLISHRLGAVRSADRIAVLDEGRVHEIGTHAELLDKNGLYARLFRLQASGYSTEAPA